MLNFSATATDPGVGPAVYQKQTLGYAWYLDAIARPFRTDQSGSDTLLNGLHTIKLVVTDGFLPSETSFQVSAFPIPGALLLFGPGLAALRRRFTA